MGKAKQAVVEQGPEKRGDAAILAVIAMIDDGLSDAEIVRRLRLSHLAVAAIRSGRDYLTHSSFRESNNGPEIVAGNGVINGRDPSPDQIRRRCEAIRRAIPRQPVGPQKRRWTAPEIAAPSGSTCRRWADVTKNK